MRMLCRRVFAVGSTPSVGAAREVTRRHLRTFQRTGTPVAGRWMRTSAPTKCDRQEWVVSASSPFRKPDAHHLPRSAFRQLLTTDRTTANLAGCPNPQHNDHENCPQLHQASITTIM